MEGSIIVLCGNKIDLERYFEDFIEYKVYFNKKSSKIILNK